MVEQAGEIEAALAVTDIAADLVALWDNPIIPGFPGSERNETTHQLCKDLIEAVHHWEAFQKSNEQS